MTDTQQNIVFASPLEAQRRLLAQAEEIEQLRSALYDADQGCKYLHLYDEDAEREKQQGDQGNA
jgi:hypothetical protein